MKDFASYYDVLRISENASGEEIKKAYRELVLQFHPDRISPDAPDLKDLAEEEFKRIQEAYDVLSVPEKRKQYDEQLKVLKSGQPFGQTDYPHGPIMEVDKTHFEFKNLKRGTVVSDSFFVFNAGGGTLTGTLKSVYGWVVLSEDVIDTPYAQEIKITIDTAILLANQEYREEIEIQTNGGTETVYVNFSLESEASVFEVVLSVLNSISRSFWIWLLTTIASALFLIISLFYSFREPSSTRQASQPEEIVKETYKSSQTAEAKPEAKSLIEDVAIYQTLLSQQGPVGYAPVIRERRDASGNVLERRLEYLRKEEMERVLANEEQVIFYPKTGAFYPIKKSQYPEFYKKIDLNGDGVITLYELGEIQPEFHRITTKYPEGDVDSIVKEFLRQKRR